ncbi:MAG TPA: T9SS type A sorting domain-containing protein, partial [Bacteroidia bacterium]|nr:T9SS type A sorting domain-containing protein [Bacteroidia bacterium]
HLGAIHRLHQSFCQDINIADVDHNGYDDILFVAQYPNGIFGTINKFTLLRNNTVATTLNIHHKFPSGGECFPNNAIRNIQWLSSVPAGNQSSVQIAFSETGNTGPWTTIANAAPNNGNFQWAVPAGITSSNCYIRLIVTDSTTLLTNTSYNSNAFQVGVCDPTLALSETASSVSFYAFPNPFMSSLNIKSVTPISSVLIVDPTGREIYSQINIPEPKQLLQINTDTFAKGVYFVKATSVSGAVLTHKVTKY